VLVVVVSVESVVAVVVVVVSMVAVEARSSNGHRCVVALVVVVVEASDSNGQETSDAQCAGDASAQSKEALVVHVPVVVWPPSMVIVSIGLKYQVLLA